ncbi:MAG: rRNA pseudouridine synthase [Clostridiaceae bacterium]|nr:rRNA pseudouridine synthase [Clostridiaceae bacterium]
MPKFRLDKFLRDQGIATRSELKEYIRKGLVRVNDDTVKDPGTHIDSDSDKVYVNGELINYKKFVYYMLNKPRGVITATEDNKENTVLDLFPEDIRRRNVFPAGRLDKDTEGLLIITNDGIFAHNLMSPKKHVKKLYEAVLDCFPGDRAIDVFAVGVVLDDGYKSLPAKLEFLQKQGKVIARVEIFEGKFHQVKRMFKAVGANVLFLKRLRIGGLWLDEALKPGEYRELSQQELDLLGG